MTEIKEYEVLNLEEKCPSSLKVTISSLAYNVKLKPSSCNKSLSNFLHTPALKNKKGDIVFGGNAISKSLSLVNYNTLWIKYASEIDEWLEYEREILRSNTKNKYMKLEKELESRGIYYLIEENVLSPVDICLIVTLSKQDGLPKVIQEYVTYHLSSSTFKDGIELLHTLIKKQQEGNAVDISKVPSLATTLEDIFTKAIHATFPQIPSSKIKIIVSKCNNAKHGDYQCNSAMPMFQLMKKEYKDESITTPQECAKAIIGNIPSDNNVVDNLNVQGPGFILFKIHSSYLQTYMNHILLNSLPKINDKATKDVVAVDFSSPNIAKEMHVGHLRSTIIGEAVSRILEYCNYNVHRINHVGDWGTQFGMLIQYLKDIDTSDQKDVGITDLTEFYKAAKKRFDEDAEFKKASQLNVVQLQSGDEECKKIWEKLCDISRLNFEKVYKRLHVTLTEVGESFYNPKIPAVIEELEKLNLITIEEGGAKCMFLQPKFKIPLMMQKSDGGYGYDSTDMAALKYRIQELHAKRIIYITDFSQGDHFKMIFEAGKVVGWVKDESLEHIGFGTVQGEDGKRFKTRSGDTVRLVDLLDEAKNRMAKQLKERIQENKANITMEEVEETASILGYSAVKYFDLRRNPTTNYVFSYDRMLDTKGNTAIYLLYQHARLESIITKALSQCNVDIETLFNQKKTIFITHPSESNLAFQISMFYDVIQTTLDDLYPYHICDYLYAVCNAVAEFVTQCKVLGSEEMESRLLLCRLTAVVMRKCFDLLGIEYVMRI